MTHDILGLHHITAIAGKPSVNYRFYKEVLSLRLIKKTVNFDDPGSYHLYYGNEDGTPGTVITFFPWEGAGKGTPGIGMATETCFSVPAQSLSFWADRLKTLGVVTGELEERFGNIHLPFSDPDGLSLSMVDASVLDERKGSRSGTVAAGFAIKGFNTVTLSLRKIDETAKLLTDIFGYRIASHEGNRYRFITDAINTSNSIDLLEVPDGKRGHVSTGSHHHVAFRVNNKATQMEFREKILEIGIHITEQIDRTYFNSIYFREPGGVLFEIATDTPGFTVDEELSLLGSSLKLPGQFEPSRAEIEENLPDLY